MKRERMRRRRDHKEKDTRIPGVDLMLVNCKVLFPAFFVVDDLAYPNLGMYL